MSVEQFERFYVLEQFRAFYAAVLRHKQQIEAGSAPAQGDDGAENLDALLDTGGPGPAEELDPARLQQRQAEDVHRDLLSLLQEQAQAVLRRGDEREQKRLREVQYVMAAAADEVFLNLSWPGRDYWRNNLLEEELFRSHDSGTRFFANLEALLRQRDPTRAEVAAAYLLALSLGFRGRYREVEHQARLDNYRQQLFAALFQRNPGLSDDAQIYPQPYAHTLSGKQVQWLPLLRPWLLGMAGVVLAYITIAHVVWAYGSSHVAEVVERFDRPGHAERAPAAGPASASGRLSPREDRGRQEEHHAMTLPISPPGPPAEGDPPAPPALPVTPAAYSESLELSPPAPLRRRSKRREKKAHKRGVHRQARSRGGAAKAPTR